MNAFVSFHGAGIENILLLSAGTIDFVFSVLVYFTDKHREKNILFSLFGISVSAWAFSMVAFNLAIDPIIFSLSASLLYIFAACSACFFFFLSTSLKGGMIDLVPWRKMVAVVLFFSVLVLSVIPNLVVIPSKNPFIKELGIGHGYLLYGLYIIVYFSGGLFSLFREYRASSNFLTRKQIFFLTIGTLIAILIGVNTNLIFPYFNKWDLFWFGPVGTVFIVIFVGYATIRHNLFNTKSVAVESVSFLIWVVMFMRLFLSASVEDFMINGTLFLFVVGGGFILIASIYKEIETRERVEKLAKELEIANEHLRVLDKQKSEFVSIASHQLRTPLTAIIGYSSMLLEGTYGRLSASAIETVSKIYQSSRRLAGTIDDFLTISHIEQGKMDYVFTTVEIKSLLNSLVEEFTPQASLKNIKVHFTDDGYDLYNVTADNNKIRQVLSNLIDNAMKYGKGGNDIDVSLTKDFGTHKTRIAVRDSGIGMTQETIGALFQKFSRAKEVQKVYTEGSGIGLYIAQEMIKAHHGRIWVESEGEGKGATFFVELLSEE